MFVLLAMIVGHFAHWGATAMLWATAAAMIADMFLIRALMPGAPKATPGISGAADRASGFYVSGNPRTSQAIVPIALAGDAKFTPPIINQFYYGDNFSRMMLILALCEADTYGDLPSDNVWVNDIPLHSLPRWDATATGEFMVDKTWLRISPDGGPVDIAFDGSGEYGFQGGVTADPEYSDQCGDNSVSVADWYNTFGDGEDFTNPGLAIGYEEFTSTPIEVFGDTGQLTEITLSHSFGNISPADIPAGECAIMVGHDGAVYLQPHYWKMDYQKVGETTWTMIERRADCYTCAGVLGDSLYDQSGPGTAEAYVGKQHFGPNGGADAGSGDPDFTNGYYNTNWLGTIWDGRQFFSENNATLPITLDRGRYIFRLRLFNKCRVYFDGGAGYGVFDGVRACHDAIQISKIKIVDDAASARKTLRYWGTTFAVLQLCADNRIQSPIVQVQLASINGEDPKAATRALLENKNWGMALTAADHVDTAAFDTWSTLCAADEPQTLTDRTYADETKASDILGEIGNATRSFFAYSGGKIRPFDDRVKLAPDGTITDAEMLPQSLARAGKGSADRPNKIIVRYPDRSYGFAAVDLPIEDAAAAYGVDQHLQPMSFSGLALSRQHQAHVCGSWALQRARNRTVVEFMVDAVAAHYEVMDVVNLTSTQQNWIAKPFRIYETELQPDHTMRVRAEEYRDDIYLPYEYTPWHSDDPTGAPHDDTFGGTGGGVPNVTQFLAATLATVGGLGYTFRLTWADPAYANLDHVDIYRFVDSLAKIGEVPAGVQTLDVTPLRLYAVHRFYAVAVATDGRKSVAVATDAPACSAIAPSFLAGYGEQGWGDGGYGS